ncbi:MAG: tRNA-dihydrouridine synthase [Candidatus Magasanikbacteria bacterium]|jgi:tRNA-dihydrouridine synthase B|nr:tRNA-dihydrouridine synthase [Candidatus Magasanikbacteria bacterium]MBT4221029.1 tRNA-dihydrouridine synthase [Candidatus Magasanikbacteria bacterium]MBT4350627.1 tRNA-dihydrouridine synthase [Candidatus Magasanikbacteria bacterium]MBT4542074.1 tRNA-dihydrouridine synthase [Candidatus Magasanikbacteria bacterium]MBT6253566.1 tRNA-dihydrouridine synthase [Candidatus Magasanikbacteria bacterium]
MWIKDILDNKEHILALSPMADMTDSAFCQIVRGIGGADIVFREMVSSEAIIRNSEKTLGMTDFVESERPIVQQIFGADAKNMAKAAEIVMKHANPEGIDINMGCPVYKLTSNFNGAALMKEPTRAANIVKEMKQAIGDTPLSVKIRLGWNDEDTFKTFIPIIEEAGADLITIHGRTKKQGYSGKSDWERIREAKEIAEGPLLANGDIHDPTQVQEALEQTGADGVLIARGALGNPWFFKQALDPSFDVSMKERVTVVLDHARHHIAQYGDRGIVTFRKHLSWYFKTNKMKREIPGIKAWRGKLVRVSSYEELEEILKEIENI